MGNYISNKNYSEMTTFQKLKKNFIDGLTAYSVDYKSALKDAGNSLGEDIYNLENKILDNWHIIPAVGVGLTITDKLPSIMEGDRSLAAITFAVLSTLGTGGDKYKIIKNFAATLSTVGLTMSFGENISDFKADALVALYRVGGAYLAFELIKSEK